MFCLILPKQHMRTCTAEQIGIVFEAGAACPGKPKKHFSLHEQISGDSYPQSVIT